MVFESLLSTERGEKIVCMAIIMKNIAIVSDSSVSLTEKEIKDFEVYVVPNLIIHKDKTYQDQVDITEEKVVKLLNDKEKAY